MYEETLVFTYQNIANPKPSSHLMMLNSLAVWAAVKQDVGSSILWSARVGSTRADQEGSGGAGSSRGPPDRGAAPQQAVLLVPVTETAPAGECLQHVVGAWLQSILRKYVL